MKANLCMCISIRILIILNACMHFLCSFSQTWWQWQQKYAEMHIHPMLSIPLPHTFWRLLAITHDTQHVSMESTPMIISKRSAVLNFKRSTNLKIYFKLQWSISNIRHYSYMFSTQTGDESIDNISPGGTNVWKCWAPL